MSLDNYILEQIELILCEEYENKVPSWFIPRGKTPFATTLKNNDWPMYTEYVDSIVQEYEQHLSEMFYECGKDINELIEELHQSHGIDKQELLEECFNQNIGNVKFMTCNNCGTEQYVCDDISCHECDSDDLEEL